MVIATVLALLQAPTSGPGILLTPEELAGMLSEPNLVIFHIGDQRSRPTYDEGHIPGAQFVNPFTDLAAPRVEGALALELPALAQLDSVLEAKGVSDDARIVLYTANQYFTPLSRTFFTLEYAGLRGRVRILDGGLEAWKAAGRSTTAEVPAPSHGRLMVQPDSTIVTDAAWLSRHLDDPAVAIVDARDRRFFEGADARQARSGRIPGARSLPFSSVIDTTTGHFKPRAALGALLDDAGAAAGRTVVTYCHIGQQASLVWLAARLAGRPARLYDGSFQDWAARSELPVVTGK